MNHATGLRESHGARRMVAAAAIQACRGAGARAHIVQPSQRLALAT